MKRVFFISLFFFLIVPCLCSQDLMVYRLVGNVEIEKKEGKVKKLQLKDIVSPSTVVNVPYEAMVELLDKDNAKRYTIKTPGKGSIEEMAKEQGNTVLTLSKQYIAYVISQMQNSSKVVSAQKFTDFATVTRDSSSVKKKPKSDKDWFLEFRNEARKEFEDYRQKCNKEYNDFVRQAWEEFSAVAGVPIPQEHELEPIIFSPEEHSEKLKIVGWVKKVVSNIRDITVVRPRNVDQIEKETPQPLEPVKEVEIPVSEEKFSTMPFSFYGTDMQIRLDETKRVNIGSISPGRIADALEYVSSKVYDNALYDFLNLRKEHRLCDWAYLNMLKTACEQFCGPGTNESVLMTGYFFCQSGYKVRYATDNTQLYLLVGCENRIYSRASYQLNGESFYPVEDSIPDRVCICPASMPREKSLSLSMPPQPKFAEAPTVERTIKSKTHPDFSVSISVNKNLIDFYNTYPTFDYNMNVMTRWASYANTPLDEKVKEELYPQFRKLMAGKSQFESVSLLLDWIQYGFPYEFDSSVWGRDRAFYAEETLFYSGCDCEDRSILLTRLVRDLLGLKCILVYYPGHLAAGVHFDENVAGDSFVLEEESYVVCDPTYIGADVGMQMPDLDYDAAKLILLQ